MTTMKACLLVLALTGATAFTPARPASALLPKPRRTSTVVQGEYGASGTSFYTTTEKQDTYDSSDHVLDNHLADKSKRQVIVDMLDACAEITEALRSALVTVEGSSNTFGDAQLSVDVIADELMWEACKKSSVVAYGASEEEPEVKDMNKDKKKDKAEYTVCWDPLDGSSIVDNNWAVGTMIGIWGSKTGSGDDGMLGATGRDQATSLVALYGPRTTVLVALDDGVYEFSYGCTPEGCEVPETGEFVEWICSRSKIEISKDCKIFSPANMRAAQEVQGYKQLLNHYMENKYTLRYSGGLVPDVYQQFTKQQGVFSNPTSSSSPAKLRLAFEAAPFGLLVEMAGGKTSDGVTGGSVLDVKIDKVDQRTALCIGSANEVDRYNEMICMVE
jgi:sedoheptulose-bisphosphatase